MSQARGRRIGGETRHDDVSRAGRLAGCWYALFDCMGQSDYGYQACTPNSLTYPLFSHGLLTAPRYDSNFGELQSIRIKFDWMKV